MEEIDKNTDSKLWLKVGLCMLALCGLLVCWACQGEVKEEDQQLPSKESLAAVSKDTILESYVIDLDTMSSFKFLDDSTMQINGHLRSFLLDGKSLALRLDSLTNLTQKEGSLIIHNRERLSIYVPKGLSILSLLEKNYVLRSGDRFIYDAGDIIRYKKHGYEKQFWKE